MPEAGGAFVGEQVRRHPPAVPRPPEHPLAGNDHVVEEHLGELIDPVHGAQRPHGDAGGVHVGQEGGDPAVARRGAGEQDAAGRVLGQARPDLLPADYPVVAAGHRPGDQRRQVAARTRLGEPLAPLFKTRQQPGNQLRGQGRPGVGDHRRGEHLDHRVEAGFGQVPAGHLLAEHGPEQRRPAQAADLGGPAVPHPAPVPEGAADPGELRHLPVERAIGPRGQVVVVQPVPQARPEPSGIHPEPGGVHATRRARRDPAASAWTPRVGETSAMFTGSRHGRRAAARSRARRCAG